MTPDLRILPHFAVVARVAEDSRAIVDYFMLPAGESRRIFVGINGKAAHEWAERYRYQTLDDIF